MESGYEYLEILLGIEQIEHCMEVMCFNSKLPFQDSTEIMPLILSYCHMIHISYSTLLLARATRCFTQALYRSNQQGMANLSS